MEYKATEHHLQVLQKAVRLLIEYGKIDFPLEHKEQLEEILRRMCNPRGKGVVYHYEDKLTLISRELWEKED